MKDPYRLVITGLQYYNEIGITKLRIYNFKKRWEAYPAARIKERFALNYDAKIFEVVFDSRAWTGRS